MNLDHLKYFSITAQTLHTTRAANIAGVSQSTICHGIRKLEEELGQELFENRGRSIVLTNAGKHLALRANDFLSQADRLKSECRAKNLPLEGKIRIGAVHGLSSRLVAPLFGDFPTSHPKLVIEFYSLRSADIVSGVVAQTLDLGICFSPVSHPGMRTVFEKKMRLHIAVKKTHPLFEQKERASVTSLRKYPVILPRAFSGIEVCENHPELVRLGVRAEPNFIFDSYEVAASYQKATTAWSLVPEILVKELGLRAVELKDFRASANLALVSAKDQVIPEEIEKKLGQLFS